MGGVITDYNIEELSNKNAADWKRLCEESKEGSFFHTLKNELTEKIFTTKEEARKAIFEYIECWYNTKRLHSSLGYMSPKEYAEKYSYAA